MGGFVTIRLRLLILVSLFVLTGRVGKLSIKVPWKKLGWEPIIIKLEDVFISATQRSDQEVIVFLFLVYYPFFWYTIHDKGLHLTLNVVLVIAVEFRCG